MTLLRGSIWFLLLIQRKAQRQIELNYMRLYMCHYYIQHMWQDHYQLLINLCHEIPEWFSRFERIIEIVNSNKSYQDSKRENFQFYKDRGYPLGFYDLTKRTAHNKS